MTNRTTLRLALGALAGLGVGTVGVIALPPLLVPSGERLETQAAALIPTPSAGTAAQSLATTAAPELQAAAANAAIAPEATSAPVDPGPALDPLAPGFDTVRVEPDGSALIAGRAEPGATVTVLAGEETVAEAEADADGNFVAFLSLAPSAEPRALSLRDAQGRASEATVLLAPADPQVVGESDEASVMAEADEATAADAAAAANPAETVVASAAEAPDDTADNTAPAAEAAGVLAQVASTPDADRASPALPEPGQTAVLLSDASGVRVLQPSAPAGTDPQVLSAVALDAIAYDGAGEVVLQGRAAEGSVRIYLDNRPVAEARVGPDNQWSVPLPDALPGVVQTLRLDEVDAAGDVLSRIETPFQREDRAGLEAALASTGADGQPAALRIVQPGNTLWAIARDRYDEPMLYLQVFEANRDRIRNPDLIYPGQIFVLPDVAAN